MNLRLLPLIGDWLGIDVGISQLVFDWLEESLWTFVCYDVP